MVEVGQSQPEFVHGTIHDNSSLSVQFVLLGHVTQPTGLDYLRLVSCNHLLINRSK
jgi:hypothetical protein